MNTIRSTGYGWGVLIVAGAGAYYFAKKSINEDKAERQEKELQRRMLVQRMEAREHIGKIPRAKVRSKDVDHTYTPSSEADRDPDPIDRTQLEMPSEKSRYTPAVPFRSKKGDRFS